VTPARPHSSVRRDELLGRLLVWLTTTDPPLEIADREVGDPTIALLDAWATAGDVLGFYLDRIADEGYLSSATEPGSILALAGLAGHRPQPGIAARLHLAYQLNIDPQDKAVLLQSGLLSQTIPDPGQLPQIFETTEALVARPSWGNLKPKQARPLSAPTFEDANELRTVVVTSATANVAANETLMFNLADGGDPALRRVAAADADITTGLTTLTLQPLEDQAPAATVGRDADSTAPADQTASSAPPGAPDQAPASVTATGVIDELVAYERVHSPPPVPASANELPRNLQETFAPESDATPRLLAALQPAIGPVLYPAVATTPIGRPTVASLSVLRVDARPFGALVPPIQHFDEQGQPAGTDDWPIGDTHRLTLRIRETDFGLAVSRAPEHVVEGVALRLLTTSDTPAETRKRRSSGPPAIEVSCAEGPLSRQGVIDLVKKPWTADLGDLGRVDLSFHAGAIKLTYTGNKARVESIEVTAKLDPGASAVLLQFDGGASQSWVPGSRVPVHTQIGSRRLSITTVTEVVGATAEPLVILTIETPLALSDDERKELPLDAIYDEIVPGTPLVIERIDDESTDIHDVVGVKTVTVDRYGTRAEVTQLTLGRPWLKKDEILQSALRARRIRARPEPLELQPVSIADEDVEGATIELDGLIAGMDPGRLIAVRGERTDLPGGAVVQGGEIAMVARILQVSRGDGEAAHTTLVLAASLTYSYRRESVRIYGNVVPARQGATIQEVLGSGDPSQAHQTFTLASAPVLADPASTAQGSRSTLTVTVDGAGYQEVARFDDATPPQSFLTAADPLGHTMITFPAPLPAGTENVRAAYRSGDGAQGNARAGQVTQLLSRPAGLAEVSNPLPATGGRAGDGPEAVRSGTPRGLRGLGRIVSVSDYADRALAWTGVGKASAELVGDPRREHVVLTVASREPVPLDPAGSLCSGISAAIAAEADPLLPVLVLPAALFMIVLGATVTHDPLVGWDATVDAVRAALLQTAGYANRDLGQDVARGDLIAAAHRVPAVRSFTVTSLALVPTSVTATALGTVLPELLKPPIPEILRLDTAAARWRDPKAPPPPPAAGLAYLSDAVPDTLILREHET
jgi:predicted phage baseplate assembly protein